MHVPKTPTAQIDAETFESALRKALEPQEYDETHWLYVPPYYTEYRYILGTIGKNPLICVGINPSTAEPNNLDNTLKSVERIAHGNGYDSFIMFNVYPQRATNPDDMESDENAFLHEQNMRAFEYVLKNAESPSVWAAWGTIIDKRGYLSKCMREMTEIAEACGAKWYKAGKCSKAGHPHHPLYLKKDSILEDFDMKSYISSLEK